jgi:flagellar basal-body rod modification protein FlgD
MPIDTITPPATTVAAATAAAAAKAAAQSAPKTDTLGKDAFLKLLVAQLRYQDPSKPTDSSQFMSQTAQFTQVEKLDEIAKANTEMLAAQTLFATSALVGRTVTYTGTDGSDVSGVVTSASFGPTGPILKVGTTATEVPVSAVKEIRQSVAAPAAPPAA